MIAWIMASVSEPDDQAFMIELYQRYDRLMFSTTRKYIDDPHIREEVVQDTLVALIQNISTLRTMGQCQLGVYVRVAVRNRAITYLRARKRAQEHFVSLDEQNGEHLSSDGPTLDELVLRGETVERLEELWDVLPPEDHLLLEGRYILGYSDQELAAQLGCKPDSIRMKLTRARRRALERLSDGKEAIGL